MWVQDHAQNAAAAATSSGQTSLSKAESISCRPARCRRCISVHRRAGLTPLPLLCGCAALLLWQAAVDGDATVQRQLCLAAA